MSVLIDAFTALAVVAAITALAFWRDNLFLYALAVPVTMVYGFTLAAGEANGSPLWIGGIIIAIIGMYCLFKVATMGLGEIKARRK